MLKPIRRNKTFEKHYKLRIATDAKLDGRFRIALKSFIDGGRGYPLNDHPLTGSLKGMRAFSVANDVRVIYIETPTEIIFLDIGSHNQVYR